MPTNNIILDGLGTFQQDSENAGAIKFGEFSEQSINTGTIAVSAVFTGTAVNSGTIGNFLPYATSVLVQSNSANWDTAYATLTSVQIQLESLAQSGGGPISIASSDISDFNEAVDARVTAGAPDLTGYVTTSDSRLTDDRNPLSHVHTTDDITGFVDDVQALIDTAAGNSVPSLVNGKVPSIQLPSYVDDVEEAANLAAFPATGESGKIYVAVDTNKVYRWSGSAYVEISPSPGSTDSVTEGSSNLYFTNARAVNALQSTVNALSAAIPTASSSTNYNNTYTAVAQNSATWASTNFGSISATSVSLDAGMISTYSNPVTASGDFLVVTIGNRQRLIRIWDFA